MNIDNTTICAISTPAGVGGIAVIRISGSQAINIVSKIWKGKPLHEMASHTAHLGKIIETDGNIIDEVVATIYRAPRTFTGEDIIEIACHGSLWIQQQIIKMLIDAGARMATGGEFTQRAFLNRRIDLSQAEAIADVIASASRASHRIAISQMRGGFSRELSALRSQLLEFASLLELELDFSEEEVNFADRSQLHQLATNIHQQLATLAHSFSIGNVIKNGIPVAIVGETNVGKSTLLNTLLNEERALVSNIHGTTRDVIEDTITIAGTQFRFIDTAGIRATDDTIESMGIQRTFGKLNTASIILWLIDPTSQHADLNDMYQQLAPHINESQQLIVVINKTDAVESAIIEKLQEQLSQTLSQRATYKTLTISAKERIGIEQLTESLISAAQLPANDSNQIIVTNARHYEALTAADTAIIRAIDGLDTGISGDFIAQDVRECIHHIGEITGEITTHEILGTIFSRFCIGK